MGGGGGSSSAHCFVVRGPTPPRDIKPENVMFAKEVEAEVEGGAGGEPQAQQKLVVVSKATQHTVITVALAPNPQPEQSIYTTSSSP